MSAPLRISRTTKSILGPDDGLKPYLDRLLKLIPAEVLSLYLVGNGVIPPGTALPEFIWAGFCLAAVGLVKAYGTSDAERKIPPDWTHVALSMIAFVIWTYSLGGPFLYVGIYKAYVGSLLILAFTFLVPFLYKGPSN